MSRPEGRVKVRVPDWNQSKVHNQTVSSPQIKPRSPPSAPSAPQPEPGQSRWIQPQRVEPEARAKPGMPARREGEDRCAPRRPRTVHASPVGIRDAC
eukprot:2489200-Rhodomonas_salina.1